MTGHWIWTGYGGLSQASQQTFGSGGGSTFGGAYAAGGSSSQSYGGGSAGGYSNTIGQGGLFGYPGGYSQSNGYSNSYPGGFYWATVRSHRLGASRFVAAVVVVEHCSCWRTIHYPSFCLSRLNPSVSTHCPSWFVSTSKLNNRFFNERIQPFIGIHSCEMEHLQSWGNLLPCRSSLDNNAKPHV